MASATRLATAVVAMLGAVLATPAHAVADSPAPQPNTPCPSELSGAMTWLPEATAPLQCVGAPAGYQWQTVDTPYPVSDKWFSYGPQMKLHGEGLRNATIKSGDWVATPLQPDTRCRSEQRAVVPGTPAVTPPRIDESRPGEPLDVVLVPLLFSVQLSGDCLWTKQGQPPQ